MRLQELGDDSRYLQISAPVQPGNSGGPLLDASGHVAGIVTGKLDAVLAARFFGDIPQNVNFALKADVARTFLDSNGISYQSGHSEMRLSPADVGDIARPFTVQVECLANAQMSHELRNDQSRASVKQQAVLYEEHSTDQMGKRYVGSASWRTETISPGPGKPPEPAVHADVDIPERHMTMTSLLRRNDDKGTTATPRSKSMSTCRARIPRWRRRQCTGRPDETIGASAWYRACRSGRKDRQRLLSAGAVRGQSDAQQNVQLLKERPSARHSDCLCQRKSRHLAIEKGSPGDRAFAEAFAACEKSPTTPPSPTTAEAGPAAWPPGAAANA